MLASHGTRAVSHRQASNFLTPWPGGHGQRLRAGHRVPPLGQSFSRTFHYQGAQHENKVFMRQGPASTLHSFMSSVFAKSRQSVLQLFEHLSTPPQWWKQGSSASSYSRGVARSLFQGSHPVSAPSIHQGLSFPTRIALSRQLQPRFFPRPPAIPRSIAHVGLGTVRNFCVARPVFQNLVVEKVPVALRALYEADLDLDMHKEQKSKLQRPILKKGKEMSKTRQGRWTQENAPIVSRKDTTAEAQEEMNRFFSIPDVQNVTTCLLVPLSPPSDLPSPAPLPARTASLHETEDNAIERHPALLPLQELGSLLVAHELHNHRVSSLFARLDASNVWARGAQLTAYSRHEDFPEANGDRNGVCTVLKVEFVGWTKAEVRGVIGESGTGWCALEEHTHNLEEMESLSEFESDTNEGDWEGDNYLGMSVDPAQALFMPTIDVSDFSSFRTLSSRSPSPPPPPTSAFSMRGVAPTPPPQRVSNGLLLPDLNLELDPWFDCGGSDRSFEDSVFESK